MNEEDEKLINFFELKFKEYKNQMQDFQIDRALKSIFELLSETNSYVDKQAPWSLKKTDFERMNNVLFLICNIIIKSSIMLNPIIPESTNKALKIFNIDPLTINFTNFSNMIDNDIIITNPKPIFPRIE
jgi:methionyl-tRNA synthetase